MMRLGSISAAALIASAASAAAQTETPANVITSGRNFDFKVDGFFTGGIAFIDTDDDKDNVGFARDSEVIFNFELTSERGLTFGAQTELEAGDPAASGGAEIDENFAFIRGNFGAVEFGEADGAKDAYSYSAIVRGPFSTSQDETGFLFDYYQGDTGVALTSYGDDTGDALKISFYTPSISGLSAGLSYVPEPGAENGAAVPRDGLTNAIELGAGYEREIGGIAFALGAGWASDTTGAEDDDSSWGGGAKLGFGALSVGLQYGFEEVAGDESSIGGGVAYSDGPWAVGADVTAVIDAEETEGDLGVSFGFSYSLAPGVDIGGVVEYAHDEDDGADGERDSLAIGVLSGFAF